VNTHLHIVSFDLPYPPDYGGVIDVYYKIRFLHEAGVKVHLHYFRYGKERCDEASCRTGLERYCESVNAYPRKTGWRSFFSMKPYIVYSRRSEGLITNLLADDHPILFEGLHTCYYLDDPRLKGRRLVYRESNIEHEYYRHLASAERSWIKKLYFIVESAKLKRFQQALRHATVMLTVSQSDSDYLRQQFPGMEVTNIPSFHRDNEVTSVPGNGGYILYQGNLSVPENVAAAEYLLEKIWQPGLPALVIAGKDPAERLKRMAAKHTNVQIIANPDDDTMFGLLRDAHINILLTFQPTGLKLKLLNALFNGRFCLTNRAMLTGTGLQTLCTIAGSPKEFREEIVRLSGLSFTEADKAARRELLLRNYSNAVNGEMILKMIRG
jgi:hypothetical protein